MTYENILKALESPEFTAIDGESLKPFLKGLYYYSLGDRTRPIPLFKPSGAKPSFKPLLYPDGMKVSGNMRMDDFDGLVKEYGSLNIPDDDTISSVVSLGAFAEEAEDVDRSSSTNTRGFSSHATTRHKQTLDHRIPPSVHQPRPMHFASNGFGERISTPVVHSANTERRFETNGRATSGFGGHQSNALFAD